MEDFIAYLILAVVIGWFARNIYRKVTRPEDTGCSGGCENCTAMDNQSCSDDNPENRLL